MSQLIRVMTAGQVDDGKSTLLGRLVHDSGHVYQDQLQTLKSDVNNEIDYSQIFDALESEREKKITIDVAYRYFYHKGNKIILADCPGHVEFIKNLTTAALNSDFAILLIDASRGLHEQTRRHLYCLQLFGVKKIIFAINKMDLVQYHHDIYKKIVDEVLTITKTLNINPVFVPTSGYKGDNIVQSSKMMSFYQGPTLLQLITGFKKEALQSSVVAVQYTKSEDDMKYIFGHTLDNRKKSVCLPEPLGSKIKRGDLILKLASDVKLARTVNFEILSLAEKDFSKTKLIFKMLYFESPITEINFERQIDLENYQANMSFNYENYSFYQGRLVLADSIHLDAYIQAEQNKFILFDSDSYEVVAVGRVY